MSCIYISHRLEEIFEIGDRVTVMRDGEYVGTNAVCDVTRDDIIAALTHVGVLHPTSCIGDNPNAEYYAVGTTGVKVILVTMPSQGFKCGLSKCRKLRVSPYGLAGSCIQQKGIQLMHEPYEKKVAIIRKLMSVRESYSDVAPVERKHLRLDYGFWRFGELNKQANPDECSKS